MGWKDAPLAEEQVATQSATSLPAQQPPTEPMIDPREAKIAADPVTRFSAGVASPILGLLQLGANLFGSPEQAAYINERIAHQEQAKQQGMREAGTEGVDWYGLAGSMLPATGTASLVTKALPAATSLLGKAGVGAATGGAIAATTPVTETEGGYAPAKAAQVGTGVAVGGAVPPVVAGARALGRGIKRVGQMVVPGGEKAILTDFQREITGPAERGAVVDALSKAKTYIKPKAPAPGAQGPTLPGSRPTAAEALAQTPGGSPLQAHQAITAKTPGGVSAQFGKRVQEQTAARAAAVAERSAATKPMREAALQAANAQGGIPAGPLVQNIDDLAGQPGIRATDVATKVLGDVKEKLARLAGESGKIDAQDLYTVRKELGNTIQKYAKETQTWDKRMTAGLERDIQKRIDDAIEGAGGTGWRAYLAEFAQRSKALEADLARKKASLKPLQRTDLRGGVQTADDMRPMLPNLLSRPMMAANFVMRQLGLNVEPRLDAEAARRYLNPQYLAEVLKDAPPSVRQQVVNSIMERANVPLTVGAVREF